jgi:hypothetical protein
MDGGTPSPPLHLVATDLLPYRQKSNGICRSIWFGEFVLLSPYAHPQLTPALLDELWELYDQAQVFFWVWQVEAAREWTHEASQQHLPTRDRWLEARRKYERCFTGSRPRAA